MSEAKNDGGPAVAVSLRDYLAAKALMGLLACDNPQEYEDEKLMRENYPAYCDSFAESAYDMADAMLRARQK